jgi:hypothetical protein
MNNNDLEQMRAQLAQLEAGQKALDQKLKGLRDGPPVDMALIRPGMSESDAKRVAGAIVRALRSDE